MIVEGFQGMATNFELPGSLVGSLNPRVLCIQS